MFLSTFPSCVCDSPPRHSRPLQLVHFDEHVQLMWLERAKQWVLVGFLLCPAELQRPQALLLLRAVLADTWFLPIFREQYLEIHTPYVFGDAKKKTERLFFCL